MLFCLRCQQHNIRGAIYRTTSRLIRYVLVQCHVFCRFQCILQNIAVGEECKTISKKKCSSIVTTTTYYTEEIKKGKCKTFLASSLAKKNLPPEKVAVRSAWKKAKKIKKGLLVISWIKANYSSITQSFFDRLRGKIKLTLYGNFVNAAYDWTTILFCDIGRLPTTSWPIVPCLPTAFASPLSCCTNSLHYVSWATRSDVLGRAARPTMFNNVDSRL
jgi:hypothetical protein